MPGQAYAPSMYWLRWAGENNWAVHLCTSPKVLDDRGLIFTVKWLIYELVSSLRFTVK